MTEEKNPIPSIQEQILEKVISNLQEQVEFSPELINRLKELADRGELSKDKQVSQTLNSAIGE